MSDLIMGNDVNRRDTEGYAKIFKEALEELSTELAKELYADSQEEPPKDVLFEKIQDFFKHLFIDNPVDKPLDNRCYIVITRKGFSIWIAGMLCGLVGNRLLGSNKLISDRCWNKMSVSERNEFISGKDVYIADDSVITGATAQSVYSDICVREGFAKSRNVAFLSAEYDYKYTNMFTEYYKHTFPVTIEQRRSLNERIMYALHKIAVPYTADSPSYQIVLSKADFEKIKNPSNGWKCDLTPLDFGSASVITNSLSLSPSSTDNRYGANFLSRGVRVCYDEFGDNVAVSLVPWIMFDVINYDEAINYLLSRIFAINPNNDNKPYFNNPTKTTLYHQLIEGETSRRQMIVHRVISYLYDVCIVRDFEKDFLPAGKRLEFFKLPNGEHIINYHYPKGLLDEVNIIAENTCGEYGDHICPASYPALFMDEAKHNELASELCCMSYHQFDIPKTPLSVVRLEDKLCSQRENYVERGIPKAPIAGRQHPLLCYLDDNEHGTRSELVLRLIRRSMAAFHSVVISYKGCSYLLNTLRPGEGSPLAFIKYYEFIYALHCFADSGFYSDGDVELFYKKWSARLGFKRISQEMIRNLSRMSPAFWPSKELIALTYMAKDKKLPIGHEYRYALSLDCISKISEKILAEIIHEVS